MSEEPKTNTLRDFLSNRTCWNCGRRPASFGFDVNLRAERWGRWACGDPACKAACAAGVRSGNTGQDGPVDTPAAGTRKGRAS